MAKGTKIGDGYVEIKADTTAVDAATSAIPQKFAKMAASATAAGQKVRQGGMSGAMGLMVLSQAVDDMQYGFRALVNQIPMLGMAFGSILGKSAEWSTKFGAIAGIAAVAINYIINHFDQLASAMGASSETIKAVWNELWGETKDAGISAIDAIEARIKELESKPIKLAVDINELDQAKQRLTEMRDAQAAFKKMSGGHTPEEKKSGEAVTEAFANLGGARNAEVMGKLKGEMIQEIAKTSGPIQELEAKRAAAQKELGELQAKAKAGGSLEEMAAVGERMTVVEQNIKDAEEAAAKARTMIGETGGAAEIALGKIFKKAAEGDVNAQAELARRLKATGEKTLATTVESAPGAAQRELEQKGIAHERAYQAKQRAEADALNAKGLRDEQEWREKAAEDRSREADRFASAMSSRMSGEILRPGGISDEALEKKVKQALETAGVAAEDIGKLVKETALKLRKDVDTRVEEKMAGGLTRPEAIRAIATEDRQKQDSLRGRHKPEAMSTDDYLKKVLVAGFTKNNGSDQIPQQQLDTQKNIVVGLREVKQAIKESRAAAGPARFAPGGMR